MCILNVAYVATRYFCVHNNFSSFVGHAEVVGLLVSAGADCTLKMGNLTIHDIAREFDHSHIADLLKSSIKMDV